MAFLIRGKTNCLICSALITCNDEVIDFPNFLPPSHKLYLFSNSVFHKKCYDAHKDKNEVERTYKQWKDIWDGRPKNIISALEMNNWIAKAFEPIWSNKVK